MISTSEWTLGLWFGWASAVQIIDKDLIFLSFSKIYIYKPQILFKSSVSTNTVQNHLWVISQTKKNNQVMADLYQDSDVCVHKSMS